MRIFYSHKTALKYWWENRLKMDNVRFSPVVLKADAAADWTGQEILDLNPCEENGDLSPVHVMWPHAKRRNNNTAINYHHFASDFPRGAFVALDSQVAIASPALAFVQCLLDLNYNESVLLGSYLGSGFALVDNSIDQRGFCYASPLLTAASVEDLASKIPNANRQLKCQPVIDHLVSNAASPREILVALLLSMPRAAGGYGFSVPELNAEIALDASQQKSLSRSYLRVDMLWRSEKVVIEYDSDQWHTAEEKIAFDSRRRNMLKSMGYDVITVTNQEIKNVGDIPKIANALAKMLHQRLRIRSNEFERKRRELHRFLLNTEIDRLIKG